MAFPTQPQLCDLFQTRFSRVCFTVLLESGVGLGFSFLERIRWFSFAYVTIPAAFPFDRKVVATGRD